MSAPGDPSVCSSVLISVLLWVELTTEAARRWSWADVGGEQDWLWTGVREDGRPCNRGRSSRPWALLKRDSDRLENGVRRPRRPVHGNCNTNDTVPSQEMFQDKKVSSFTVRDFPSASPELSGCSGTVSSEVRRFRKTSGGAAGATLMSTCPAPRKVTKIKLKSTKCLYLFIYFKQLNNAFLQ